MTVVASNNNLEVYCRPEIVQHYATASGLQPAEAYAFGKYIRRGDAVLDLGVGGGRTTSSLAAIAGSYVGLDLSLAMIEVCRKRFPELRFDCGDASDLSRFADASIDVVIFSFNGIDYLPNDEARGRCLREVERVLKRGGRLIFSSHNAEGLSLWPVGSGTWLRIAKRLARAVIYTAYVAPRKIGAFRKGSGYFTDPVHGGLATFASTPDCMANETRAAGLNLVEIIEGDYPAKPPRYFTCWYYYVAAKT